MCDLYERIVELCRKKGVSCSRMCSDLGLSKSTLSELKAGRTKSISTVTAQKFAIYLDVTVDELLGNEQDIKIKLTPDQRSEILEIFDRAIKEKNLSEGFTLARANVKSNIFNQLRNWQSTGVSKKDLTAIARYLDVLEDINLNDTEDNEKAPAASSDEALKVALFGGDTEVTDEMWHEVMNYAEFLKQKYGKT